jgi:hypothetical protein
LFFFSFLFAADKKVVLSHQNQEDFGREDSKFEGDFIHSKEKQK